MKTLLLDVDTWDFVLDANGNWAVANTPYALAQDVASSIRTLLAEVWYDTSLGTPWKQQIFGQKPPVSLFQEYMVAAALAATPPDADVTVVSAVCLIQSFSAATREVIGQVQFVDSNGNTGAVAINNGSVRVL
jgi:hypothetical protein